MFETQSTLLTGKYPNFFNKKFLTVLLWTLITSNCIIIEPIQQKTPNPALRDCPVLPNCVSTEETSRSHKIDPFALDIPIDDAWPVIAETINNMPGSSIDQSYQGYIFAKFRSKTMGFIDYFEVLYDKEQHSLKVRSSAMLGISDMGVNRKRTAEFRVRLTQNKVIKDN